MGGNHMKGKKHTPDQVTSKLAEGDRMQNEGKTAAEIVRSLGIAETIGHKWKNSYSGIKTNDAKRLETDNRRLKKIVADWTLDRAKFKDEGSRLAFNPRSRTQHCECICAISCASVSMVRRVSISWASSSLAP
jgi:hypothetical protein